MAPTTKNSPPCPQTLEAYSQILLTFFEKAGEIALHTQNKVTPQVKKETSLVTEADLSISALAYTLFSPLKEQGHFIIEEETTQTPPSAEIFKKYDTIWAIDPIDGTSAYAAKHPNYAISAGAIYKGKPLIGGVYVPALQKLFFFDGQKGYTIKNPFTENMQKEELSLLSTFNANSFFDLINSVPLKTYCLQHLPCSLTMSNAMTIGLANTAAGHLNGAYFRAFIWDFLGGWALLNAVGAKVYNIHTGAELTALNASFFETESTQHNTLLNNTPLDNTHPNNAAQSNTYNWRFKDNYIVCNPAFFTKLQKIFKLKHK